METLCNYHSQFHAFMNTSLRYLKVYTCLKAQGQTPKVRGDHTNNGYKLKCDLFFCLIGDLRHTYEYFTYSSAPSTMLGGNSWETHDHPHDADRPSNVRSARKMLVFVQPMTRIAHVLQCARETGAFTPENNIVPRFNMACRVSNTSNKLSQGQHQESKLKSRRPSDTWPMMIHSSVYSAQSRFLHM